jgi:hypothetical protein
MWFIALFFPLFFHELIKLARRPLLATQTERER